MKPDERNRRRRHGKAQKAKTQNDKTQNARSQNIKSEGVRTDLERFRSDLPDVEPVKITEAAMYYYAEPKGWWFEPACPIYPEAIGPYSSLQEAMSSGEKGCSPCSEANCTARIKSTMENLENQKSPENKSSADKPGPRAPGRCQVITLKAKPRSWPIVPKRQRDR